MSEESNNKPIGFGADVKGIHDAEKVNISNVQPQHFIKYGMMPEFLGRV